MHNKKDIPEEEDENEDLESVNEDELLDMEEIEKNMKLA
jgi:hypothetical protein